MGVIIGESAGYSTWLTMRAVVTNNNTPSLPVVIADHNQEWPAGTKYMRTIEGNGLVRVGPPTVTPYFDFTQNTPPIDDFFIAEAFADPYPADLVGRTVTTSSSSFTITAAAFTGGQSAGSGGTTPILTVDWFANLS